MLCNLTKRQVACRTVLAATALETKLNSAAF